MDGVLEKIHRASLHFLAPLTDQETYQIIVKEAVKLVDAEDGLILTVQHGGLKNVYGSSKDASQFKVRERGYAFTSYTERKAFVIHQEDFADFHPNAAKAGVRSVVFIPLSYKSKSIGVLIIRSLVDRDFTKKELEILKLYGSLASLAVRKTQLYTEAKDALEMRDQFISLASHELRTPLTSINGYIQLLYSKLSKSDSTESKWIKELHSESGRLTNLVKELLEINKLKAGKLQFNLQECNVLTLLEQVTIQAKRLDIERKIEIVNDIKDGKTKLIGDVEKLQQMFLALISNAIKFSPSDSTIKIIVKNSNSYLIIQVVDQGKGMSTEDVCKVFDGFYKASDNFSEGLGVGLLLAKHIINYHQGFISVKSKKNKGTTVEVRLRRLTK